MVCSTDNNKFQFGTNQKLTFNLQNSDNGKGCPFGFDRNLSKKCPYGYGVRIIELLTTSVIISINLCILIWFKAIRKQQSGQEQMPLRLFGKKKQQL